MMTIDIPGFGKIDIKHVVFDYNGTIARDGELIKAWPGLASAGTSWNLILQMCTL